MKYEITAPDAVKQELWNEETIYRMAGGFKLDTTNLPSALTTLPKGCMLNVNHTTRIAKLVKTVKVKTTSGATDTEYEVEKTHALKVGDIIGKAIDGTAYAITAIDTTTSATLDTITVGTTLGTLTAGDVLFQASAATANSAAELLQANYINYHDVKIEGTPSVNALGRIDEIQEAKLPYAVHALNKTSLTSRFMFV